ncbi:P-loop containing nucleoside triphosphate hydrolase protein, partial [Cladochytrium replicatum]
VFNNPLFTWWVIDSRDVRGPGDLPTACPEPELHYSDGRTQCQGGSVGVTLAWIKKVASQTIATNRMQFDSQAWHAYSTLIRDLSLLMKKIAYPLQPDQETWLTLSWLIENAPDVTCETASDYDMDAAGNGQKIAQRFFLDVEPPPRLTDLVAQNASQFFCSSLALFINKMIVWCWVRLPVQDRTDKGGRQWFRLCSKGPGEAAHLPPLYSAEVAVQYIQVETFQSILGVRVTYAEYRRFASNFSQIDSRLMPAQVSTLLRKGDMANLGEGHSSHTAEAIYNRTGSSIPQLLDVVAAERLRIYQEHEQLVPAVTSPEAVLRSGDRSNVSETVRDTAKVSETETVLGTLTVSEVLETVNVHATFREDFLANSIREAICKSEKHTLLVSPTGSGKTVVPAILAALNTAVSASEIRKRLEELRIPCYLWSEVKAHKNKLNAIAGHPGLLLCQVEQLDNPGLLSTELVQIWENGRLGTVILDECHILLTQRHFREAMTNVREFVHKSKYASRPLGSCRFLYMTATMPVVLQSAFEQQVGLGRGELSVCRSPTDRPELAYFVKSWPLAEVCDAPSYILPTEEQQAQIKSLLLGGPSAKEAVPTNMHPCCHHGSKMSELDRNVDLCRWLGWEGLDQGRDPIAAMADMSRVMIATSGLGAALNVDDVGLVVIVSCSGMMELSQMGGRAARNGSVGIEILIRNEGFMHVRTEEELSPDRAALLEYMQTSSCLRRAKITFLDGNPNAPECRNSCAKLCGNCGGQSNLYLKLGQQQETPPGQQYSGTLFSSTSSTTTSTQSDVSRVPETPRIIRTQTPNYWDSPTPLYGPPGATQPLGTYHERPFLIKPIPNRGHISPDSFSGHHFGKQRSSSSSYTLKNQKDYEESPSSSSYTMKNQMDYEENPSGLSLKRPKVWIPVLTYWSWSHPEDGSVQWLPADVGSTQSKWRTFTTEHKPNDFQLQSSHTLRETSQLYTIASSTVVGVLLLQVPQQHGVTIVAGSAENRDIVGLTVLQRRR